MWKEHLDLVRHLHEQIDDFTERTGADPSIMTLSPSAFQWLVSIFREDEIVLGVTPIDADSWTYSTDRCTLRMVIDELADDYEITVE